MDERTQTLVCQLSSKHPFNLRYEFCSRYVKDKDILDLGCGNADGLGYLSAAKSITLVDKDQETIQKLKSKHRQSNINVMCDSLPVLSKIAGKFDVVLCMEIIEHLDYKEAELAIERMLSLLRNGGTMILSTPNKKMWSPYTGYCINKYHKHEFAYEEIYGLLSSHFRIVEQKAICLSNSAGLGIYHAAMAPTFLLPRFITHMVMSTFSGMHTFATAVRAMDSYIADTAAAEKPIHFLFACQKVDAASIVGPRMQA